MLVSAFNDIEYPDVVLRTCLLKTCYILYISAMTDPPKTEFHMVRFGNYLLNAVYRLNNASTRIIYQDYTYNRQYY